MREIKFRYWDQFNAVMVYSKNFKNLAEFFHNYQLSEDGNNAPILEQYTGLKDKNGKDIYEGDIVSYLTEIESGKAVVTKMYCSNNLGFEWFEQTTMGPSLIDSVDYFGCPDELEIIGNIHENHELLEKK